MIEQAIHPGFTDALLFDVHADMFGAAIHYRGKTFSHSARYSGECIEEMNKWLLRELIDKPFLN